MAVPIDIETIWAMRQHADAARDYVEGLTVAPEPGRSEVERAERIAYGQAVEDVLRWVAGDATPSPELGDVLGIE